MPGALRGMERTRTPHCNKRAPQLCSSLPYRHDPGTPAGVSAWDKLPGVFDLPECTPRTSSIVRTFPVPFELSLFDVIPDHPLLTLLSAHNCITPQDHFPIF